VDTKEGGYILKKVYKESIQKRCTKKVFGYV